MSVRIARRTFLAGVIAGVSTQALACSASVVQPRVWRIGYLAGPDANTDPTEKAKLQAFIRALADLGYVEGRNAVIDVRVPASINALPAVAGELVASKPDVIMAHAADMARVAVAATTTIPIVFASSDAVLNRLVRDLAHPEANATGSTNTQAELITKRLELLKDAVPSVRRVAYLWDRTGDPPGVALTSLRQAADRLGIEVVSVEGASVQDLLSKATEVSATADGMIVLIGAFTVGGMSQLIELASRRRLPAIYPSGAADRGGLISFGQDPFEQYRNGAAYVDRILRGAKPSDLPVALPKQFEIVINLKTAGDQGVSIPSAVLERATRVIR